MGEDRPATQKELMAAQLEGQAELFEQVGRVQQSVNEGFAEMQSKISDVLARVAHLEGEADATQRAEVEVRGTSHLWLIAVGILISLLTSLASLGIAVTR